jgi:hypothetical protein
MKPNKISFLIPLPLSERDYARFGAELLKSRGFEVSFFDLTNIINPDYDKSITTERFNCPNNNVISKTSEFEDAMRAADGENTVFIDFIVGRKETSFAYDSLTRNGLAYACFYSNVIPSPSASIKRRIYNFITQAPVKYRFKRFKAPDYILTGGEKYTPQLPYPDKKTANIRCHTLDYDLYLDHISNKPKPAVEGKFAVFLDGYFPFDPEFNVSNANTNPFKNPDVYFNELNGMLSEIENTLGLPVVIAAHPRSRYDIVGNRYNGRTIISQNTINLVANSEIVLTHSSTAVNFAVLFNKPVIFLIPEKLKNTGFGAFIAHFAMALGKQPQDSDTVKQHELVSNERTINTDLYAKYKNEYIKTTGSPNKHFWDIVADSLAVNQK